MNETPGDKIRRSEKYDENNFMYASEYKSIEKQIKRHWDN